MKTMTWEEIDRDWAGLQKRHRAEIAEAVARYCIGHGVKEVGVRLGFSQSWAQDQLDIAGAHAAVDTAAAVPFVGGSRGDRGRHAKEDLKRVIRQFSPTVEEQGSEAFEPYFDHYKNQGHNDDVAVRLAKAEWATEAAVEAEVIKEDVDKKNQRVNRILFPDDGKDTFELDVKFHTARVLAAARFLEDANHDMLRRKSTRVEVAKANDAWAFQVKRVMQHGK